MPSMAARELISSGSRPENESTSATTINHRQQQHTSLTLIYEAPRAEQACLPVHVTVQIPHKDVVPTRYIALGCLDLSERLLRPVAGLLVQVSEIESRVLLCGLDKLLREKVRRSYDTSIEQQSDCSQAERRIL